MFKKKSKIQDTQQEMLLPVSDKAMGIMDQARVTQLLSFDRKGLLLLACKGQDEGFKKRAQSFDNLMLARMIVMRENAAYIFRRNLAFGFLIFVLVAGGVVALILTLLSSHLPCDNLPFLPYPWPLPRNLSWSECSVANGSANVSAQCVSVSVPMSWVPLSPNCQSKQTISLFLKRIYVGDPPVSSFPVFSSSSSPLFHNHDNGTHSSSSSSSSSSSPLSSASSPSTITQLWWVGREVSVAYEQRASELVAASGGSVVVYLSDRRGTGSSSYLDCAPDSLFRANITACLQSLASVPSIQDRLATTSYTNIAQDMIYLIRSLRTEAQRSVVLGSSFGGLVVQRMLSILEDTASDVLDAVIMDSSPPAGGFNLTESFLNSDGVASALIAECHASPVCSSHFGSLGGMPSWLSVYAAKEQFFRLGVSAQHPCLSLFPSVSFQNVSWAIAFQLLQPSTYQILPALLLRFARCNVNDIAALSAFIGQIPSVSALDPSYLGSSLVVEWALDWTENYFGALTQNDTQPKVCDRLSGADALTFSSTKTTRIECTGWNSSSANMGGTSFLHAADTYTTSIPNMTAFSTVRVLHMHGEWDPVVSIALVYNLAMNYSSQTSNYTFVSFPRSGHMVLDNSPTENSTCGFDMVLNFLLSNDFAVDISCLSHISSVDFEGSSEMSREQTLWFFNISSNTSDAMWND